MKFMHIIFKKAKQTEIQNSEINKMVKGIKMQEEGMNDSEKTFLCKNVLKHSKIA